MLIHAYIHLYNVDTSKCVEYFILFYLNFIAE